MTKIEYENYYHIFNKGTNGMKIFVDSSDYKYFLYLMKVYLIPVSDVFAYALMGNHFHILIRIKDEKDIGFLNPAYSDADDLHIKWKTFFPDNNFDKKANNLSKKPVPENMLQHLFIAYSKRFNEKYKRTGSLFQHPFKRIHIKEEKYLKNLILYIHKNPVHHKICSNPNEYKWTSYTSIISNKPTKLSRDFVLELFNDKQNYIFLHKSFNQFEEIDFLITE